MLAFRRSSLRFWPKLKVDLKSHVLRPCSNAIHRCKTSLNFGSVRLVHSSNISKSSVKLTGEKLRHAEITSYVESLNAQDVQVLPGICNSVDDRVRGCRISLLPLPSSFFMHYGCAAKYCLRQTLISRHPITKRLPRALLWQI